MSDRPTNDLSLFTPRRLFVQLAGFAIGLCLLAWCAKVAIEGGDWSRLWAADLRLIGALAACTGVSLFVNGIMFWVTVRPMRRSTFGDLQWLNVCCSFLNYAPIRAGSIARIAYHLRVNRMTLLQIGAWFTAIGYMLMLVVGSLVAATLVYARIDWVWAALVGGQIVLGGALARVVVGHRVIVTHGRGIDRILRSHAALWVGTAMRLLDIAAYVGRLAIALHILGLTLPTPSLVVLALVALVARMIPLGRLGFTELAVTAAAARLSMIGMDPAGVEAFLTSSGPWAQLALVESAGEAMVVIPAGLIALVWFRKRWRKAKGAAVDTPTDPV